MKNYLALIEKIDRFSADVRRRNPAALACKPGCADCCVAGIAVWRVEFDRIQEAIREQRTEIEKQKTENGSQNSDHGSRCPFLSAEDRCTIYDARPVVCRLWGLPLLFRADAADAAAAGLPGAPPARQAQTAQGALTCCQKNFARNVRLENLAKDSLVSMEVILSALAAINHVYCRGIGADPARRYKLGNLPRPLSC